jgi:hypothetical protein
MIKEKKMNKIYTLTFLLLCSFTLTGCDSFRNAFGLDHYTPNEWDTSAPSPSLILPPDFAQRPQLPPPNPGAPNPHVVPETVRAQKTVLGETHVSDLLASTTGERDILEKSSKDQEVTPDIRKKLDEESQSDGTIISKIESWKKEAAKNLSLSKTVQESSDKENSATQVSENKDKAIKHEE